MCCPTVLTQAEIDSVESLADAVRTWTGCDPRLDPDFEGVTIEPCVTCNQTTAVTSLSLDGESAARICADCMIA